MAERLRSKRIALLVTDGFEQIELTEPKRTLEEAGATTFIVAPGAKVQGMHHADKADLFDVDVQLAYANSDDFDGLVLPGGVRSPDKLRINDEAVRFVRAFVERSKPIAAICHGPWTLIEAGGVRGKQLTSYRSLRTDLQNAGATWVDEEVVKDGELLTSRSPQDLGAFNRAIIDFFRGAPPEAKEAPARAPRPQ